MIWLGMKLIVGAVLGWVLLCITFGLCCGAIGLIKYKLKEPSLH